jgi:hypothetical protein
MSHAHDHDRLDPERCAEAGFVATHGLASSVLEQLVS